MVWYGTVRHGTVGYGTAGYGLCGNYSMYITLYVMFSMVIHIFQYVHICSIHAHK